MRGRRVHPPPPLAELRAVGHLLGEGVRKGVLHLGVEHLLVHELGIGEYRQRSGEIRLREVGHAAEQRRPEAPAEHRGRLQRPLLALGQPIDPCRQHRLHGGGDGQLLRGPGQPVGTAPAHGSVDRLHAPVS